MKKITMVIVAALLFAAVGCGECGENDTGGCWEPCGSNWCDCSCDG